MNRLLGYGGLFFLVLGIFLMIWSADRDNDIFWRTRTYMVLKSDQSEHIYKGRSNPDYFQRIIYDDEPTVTWTRSVQAITYFSQDVGNRYSERDSKEAFDNIKWYFMASWALAIILWGILLFKIEL